MNHAMARRAGRTIAALGCAALCGLGQPSFAQTPRADAQVRMPSDKELEAARRIRLPDVLRPSEGVPQASTPASARPTFNMPVPRASSAGQAVELLVFASLSIPGPSLAKLVEQTRRLNGTLVLRGFPGGTADEMLKRLDEARVPALTRWRVNPGAFERFGVVSVPTVVLLPGGLSQAQMSCSRDSCRAPPEHVAVSGDVTLDYALNTIATRAPRYAAHAAKLIRQLKAPS